MSVHMPSMRVRGSIRVVFMDTVLLGLVLCLVSQTWAMPVTLVKSNIPPTREMAAYQMTRLAQSTLDLTISGLEKRFLNHDSGSCTLETLRVRRDWRALSRHERRAYIDSILCLQRLPPQTPSALAAGAKTRYDDFLATHINQTWHIHRTVSHATQGLAEVGPLLMISRARSWHGIGISSTHSKRLYATNAATAGISRKSPHYQVYQIHPIDDDLPDTGTGAPT